MRLERQFRALAMKLLPRERIVLFGGRVVAAREH